MWVTRKLSGDIKRESRIICLVYVCVCVTVLYMCVGVCTYVIKIELLTSRMSWGI